MRDHRLSLLFLAALGLGLYGCSREKQALRISIGPERIILPRGL